MLFGSHWGSSPSLHDIQAMHGLVLDMIEAGVPANERTVQGMTVFDRFIQAASFYVHRLENDSRSIGLNMLQGLLTSESYMRSLTLALKPEHGISRGSSEEDRWYRYDDLVYNTTRIARELVVNYSCEGEDCCSQSFSI